MTAPTGDSCAVALIIFRRPDSTKRVFEAIRKARPSRLFVISDGPRDHVDGESDLVSRARSITEGVDWECETTRLYSPVNLGCRMRIVSGIDALFRCVDQAIILEDDCVPDATFFPFAKELLATYSLNETIMSIGGHLWHRPDAFAPASYWLSRYPTVWGWATWSRAWFRYGEAMAAWRTLRESDWIEQRMGGQGLQAQFWRQRLDDEMNGAATWDYTWVLAHWLNDALAIRPTTNLVANVGFGPESTHTRDSNHPAAARPAHPIALPLTHPRTFNAIAEWDRDIEGLDYSGVLFRQMKLMHTRGSNR